jgi:Ca2+/H+ antiporter
MDCHVCEIIHVVGPYVLVAFFAIFLYRILKRHQEMYAQMHGRAMDVFERQNATYERVHFDLVALSKSNEKDKESAETDVSAPRRR